MEITIFDIPAEDTKQEIEQTVWQKFASVSGIPQRTVDTIEQLEIDAKNNAVPHTNLANIKCQYLLNYCTAIIPENDNKKSKTQYTIQLRRSAETPAIFDSNDKRVVIPRDNTFEICGIYLPGVYRKHIDRTVFNLPLSLTMKQMANTGIFSDYLHGPGFYTQQKSGMTHYGHPINTTGRIMFAEKDSAEHIINILTEYITELEKYYSRYYSVLLLDLQMVKTNIPDMQQNTARCLIQKQQAQWLKAMLDMASNSDLELPGIIDLFKGDFYSDAMLSRVSQQKMLPIYYSYIKLEESTAMLQDMFSTYEINVKKARKEYKQEVRKLDIIQKQNIAKDKFGIDSLIDLTRKQRDIVELEFKRVRNENLDSPTYKLYVDMIAAIQDIDNSRLKALYNDLKRQLGKYDDSKLLPDGICPHWLMVAEYNIRDGDKPWFNTELRRNLKDKYSLPEEISGYYCKLCGNHLFGTEKEDIIRFNSGERIQRADFDDPLANMIWKETRFAILNYVKFYKPIPTKPLIQSIANGIRSQVAAEQSKLTRSRTNLADSTRDTVNLYANIYIYATLAAMMMANPNKIIFGRTAARERDRDRDTDDTPKQPVKEPNPEGSGRTKPKLVITKEKREGREERKRRRARRVKKLRDITGGLIVNDKKVFESYVIRTALGIIKISKDLIIKRLKHMNFDMVKQIFVSVAYPWARKHTTPIVSKTTSQSISMSEFLGRDMLYYYTYIARGIATRNITDWLDIPFVLGMSADEIRNTMRSKGNLHDAIYKSPPRVAGKYSDDYLKYINQAYALVVEADKNRIYQSTVVPESTPIADYNEKQHALLKLENQFIDSLHIKRMRPVHTANIITDIRRELNKFNPELLDLALHYCPDGQPHRIAAYIYMDGNKPVEVTTKQVNEWINAGDTERLQWFYGLQWVDVRCGRCDAQLGKVSSQEMSDVTLPKLFRDVDRITAFYQYYRVRCPAGDLHTILGGKCTKCGMQSEPPSELDFNTDKYFKKYITTFNTEQKKNRSMGRKVIDEIYSNLARKTYKKYTAVEYKSDFEKVTKWASITGQKYNVLSNLGASHGYKWLDIVSGRKNPRTDMPDHTQRQLILRQYIYNIWREYLTIKNYERVSKLNDDITHIIQLQKGSTHNLINKLPDIFADFMLHDTHYSLVSDAEKYADWLLTILADGILTINKAKNGPNNEICDACIKYLTDLIIHDEKLYSKPESIYKTTFRDITQLEEGSSSGESDTDVGTASESEKQPNQSESAASESDDAVEFNMDNYDVENADDIWDQE